MAKQNLKVKMSSKKLPGVTVKRISSEAELARAFAIRIRVFVKEQSVPRAIELDDDDRRAAHFLATVGTRAVGTARVVLHHGAAKIGRMAVLKSYRRRGVGAKLLAHAIAAARRMKARKIYLHAQVAVVGFYQRMNFHAVGPVFDEAGIAHRKMIWRRRQLAGMPRSKSSVKKHQPGDAKKFSPT
jgi:predicted GNAT family N-acyltransferase